MKSPINNLSITLIIWIDNVKHKKNKKIGKTTDNYSGSSSSVVVEV